MAAWEPYSEPGSGGNGSLLFPPPAPSYSLSPTLTRLKAMAVRARNNNPRVNAVMTTPPALSWSATAPTGLPNIYNWSAAIGGVFDFAGGTVTTGLGYRAVQCATFGGVLQTGNQVVEFVADAAKLVLQVYETAAGYNYRVAVNGQYISTTPLASTAGAGGGAAYITIDFTSAGGRAARLIRLEGCTFFGQAYVGATEGIYKPNLPDMRMIVIGDSYVQGLGATFTNNAFAYVLKDCLGVRDMWASGVGSTGYLSNAGGAQATARGRVTDLTRIGANPDVIVSAFGHNDGPYTPAAVTAEVLLYLAAIRSAATTANVPIFVTGVLAGNASVGTLVGVESAIALAVAEFGDPSIIFIPCNNDVNGAWMTGTGNTSNLRGDGNADVYISSDNIHPNDAGHAFYGMRLADAMIRALQTY